MGRVVLKKKAPIAAKGIAPGDSRFAEEGINAVSLSMSAVDEALKAPSQSGSSSFRLVAGERFAVSGSRAFRSAAVNITGARPSNTVRGGDCEVQGDSIEVRELLRARSDLAE